MGRTTIHISCLLKDNKIMAWNIGRNQKTMPSDYYKDFIYAGISNENCDKEYEVEYMTVEFSDEKMAKYYGKDGENDCISFNDYIFERVAKEFFRHWEIHPEHWGKAAY